MKKCPECQREYFDETLNYCLDDGASLLHGRATEHEPATAIRHTADKAGDGPTRPQLHTTDATAILSGSSHLSVPVTASGRNWVVPAVLGIILAAAVGTGAFLLSGRWSSRQIGSIAVMPFFNESGNADNDYL